MTLRANWKGFLKVGELTCPVALHAAVSASQRIAFHTVNRATGHRVRRQFVDVETGRPVDSDDQVRGYETSQGGYVVLEPEEIASAIPDSDKTLAVDAFIDCDGIDDIYLDRPYYLVPDGRIAEEAFALLREGMRSKKRAALARTVLFRRLRTVLIRSYGNGLIATTLNFDYEVRSVSEAFGDVAPLKIKGEMLDLARHIIATKRGAFDPKGFEDRYEAALAELVKAKAEGRAIKPCKAPKTAKVVSLLDALRRSAGKQEDGDRPASTRKPASRKPAQRRTPSRKAG